MHKHPNRAKRNLWSFVLLSATALIAIGCGAGPQAFDESTIKADVNRAKIVRGIFDKVHGDYNALSSEDKATLLKQFDNKEENVKHMWEIMAHPPGSAPQGTGPQGQ